VDFEPIWWPVGTWIQVMGIQQDKICQGNRHGQAIFANPLPSGSLWQFNIAAIANWKITEFSNGLSNIIYQWAIFQFANS
jgi:hypothetical protein